MAYIGQGIKQGTFKVLDTSGNTYNGSNTTFNLGTQVGSAAQLLVSHDGVIQKPGTDYTLASGGASITFSTAPASGASIFITEISGAVGGTVTPSDTSVTADKLNSALLTGHTDIGGAIADADLFLTDDGAGGTLRKTAASRLKTYVGAGAGAFSIANLDIDGGTDIGADIVDADQFIIDDGAGGTNRKTTASRIKTYVGGGNHVLLGSSASGSGTSSISFNNVFSSTYDQYLILAHRLTMNTNAENVYVRMRASSSDFTSSNYNYIITGNKSNTTGTSNINVGYNNQAQWMFTRGIENTDAQGGGALSFHLFDPYDGTFYTRAQGVSTLRKASTGDLEVYTIGGQVESTTQFDGISIYPSSGTFAQHEVYIYGIKES